MLPLPPSPLLLPGAPPPLLLLLLSAAGLLKLLSSRFRPWCPCICKKLFGSLIAGQPV
jgi:hypothetical protein